MNQREEVSVTFQGTKAGGLVRRLFGTDGLDNTAIDACQLYTLENGRHVNRDIIVPPTRRWAASVPPRILCGASKAPSNRSTLRPKPCR